MIARKLLFRPSAAWSSPTIRNIVSDSGGYQGDGKTTVNILNQSDSHLNLINTYSAHGFRLSNNIFITGSILVFPTHCYSWNIKRGADINMDSLIVFDLIAPKAKIVIIGYGSHGEPYDASIPLMLKRKGISCELLPTPQAVTTYNFLVHDSVHVAGAFVPVKQEVVMTTKDAASLREPVIFGESCEMPEVKPVNLDYQRETWRRWYEDDKKKAKKNPDD